MPDLDSDTDAGYFDDFSNEQDMAKYKEVHDKQVALENLADRNDKLNKGLFVGFTFKYSSLKFGHSRELGSANFLLHRHRKEAPIASAGFLSPRKEKQVQVDDEYGTIF